MPDRELYRLTLECPPGSGRFIAQVVKYAWRRFGLRCIDLDGPPDPCAWRGWQRLAGQWLIVCAAVDEATCRRLVAELPSGECVVLRRGLCPAEPAPPRRPAPDV